MGRKELPADPILAESCLSEGYGLPAIGLCNAIVTMVPAEDWMD